MLISGRVGNGTRFSVPDFWRTRPIPPFFDLIHVSTDRSIKYFEVAFSTLRVKLGGICIFGNETG